MLKLLSTIFSLFAIICLVKGHGMMLDPPNRSSMWRFDASAPTNYNDNENFCGGFPVQWGQNGGKCGTCGDNYILPHPQPNENTGIYGRGKIAAIYKSGQIIDVHTQLTANHLGYFEYHLCDLKDDNKHETEDCFQLLKFADGKERFPITSQDYQVRNRVKLPDGFKCERCVLRWHYNTGNNWGLCTDGSGAVGCGPQETFRSCADIQIV